MEFWYFWKHKHVLNLSTIFESDDIICEIPNKTRTFLNFVKFFSKLWTNSLNFKYCSQPGFSKNKAGKRKTKKEGQKTVFFSFVFSYIHRFRKNAHNTKKMIFFLFFMYSQFSNKMLLLVQNDEILKMFWKLKNWHF